MTTWRELAIAIPTFRRNGPLLEVLRSIESQSTKPGLILVIDNSPDACAQEVVRDYASGGHMMVEYLPLYANCGPAGSFASAAAALLSRPEPLEWMMCRGDDNPFAPHFLIESIRVLSLKVKQKQPACIGISGGRYNLNLGQAERTNEHELENSDIISVDYVPGYGCPTYNIAELKALGVNFKRDLFFGFEELDIGLQIKKANGTLLVDCASELELRDRLGLRGLPPSESEPGRRTAAWRSYFGVRNSLLIARQFATPSGFARCLLRATKRLARALIKLRSIEEARAVALGIYDGLLRPRTPRRQYIKV